VRDAHSIYATPRFGVDTYPQRVWCQWVGHGVCQRTLTAPMRHPSTALHSLSHRTGAPVHTTTPPIIVDSTKGLGNDYAHSMSGKCAWRHEIKVSYDTILRHLTPFTHHFFPDIVTLISRMVLLAKRNGHKLHAMTEGWLGHPVSIRLRETNNFGRGVWVPSIAAIFRGHHATGFSKGDIPFIHNDIANLVCTLP
jgi:hypothetical protein